MPQIHLPFFTATRVLFNEALRWRNLKADTTIGIDADGYAIAGKRNSAPHIACIKGVIGTVAAYGDNEVGATGVHRLQPGMKRHTSPCDAGFKTDCVAERIEELYGINGAAVVPELIDLKAWRQIFQSIPARQDQDKFTVLCVCRFYPRKGLETLLRAAAQLRTTIPKGGTNTPERRTGYFRQIAVMRKIRAGGRPKKRSTSNQI